MLCDRGNAWSNGNADDEWIWLCDGGAHGRGLTCRNASRRGGRPSPALARSVKLSLRSRELECYDYATSDNPPVLHRKEAFLAAEHRLYEKFARLTRQEEKHGLLD